MKTVTSAVALSLCLAACSPSSDNQAAASDEVVTDDNSVAGTEFTPPPAPGETPTPDASTTPSALTLTLEGLGALRIGQALPTDGGWKQDRTCSAASSPAYPGVYAIVEHDKVRRITVHGASQVKLTEGIGVGSDEAVVAAAFPGFRSEPHKYEAKPAKYLTAPNAGNGDVALRFEIGTDGKVKAMHVGTMPALAYAEGCG